MAQPFSPRRQAAPLSERRVLAWWCSEIILQETVQLLHHTMQPEVFQDEFLRTERVAFGERFGESPKVREEVVQVERHAPVSP